MTSTRSKSFDEIASEHVGNLFGWAAPRHNAQKKKLKAAADRKANFIRPDVSPTKIPPLKQFVPIPCPCCKRAIDVPALDVIVQHYKIPKAEERILRAVWNGKGRAVQTEQIFNSMYAHDADGGPSPGRMYAAFKAGLHNIRCRLVGSGVAIESAGYRQGFRITIGGK